MFRNDQNPEAAESQRLIEAGGLPPAATARLKENAARQGTDRHFFTSNLSVNEFLLTHDCGYEPLGQIMGTSVYHVGWAYFTPSYFYGWGSQELGVLTQAYYEARTLAFGRLFQEAKLLGADGVVGVRFERIGQNLPEGIFEFKAVGTAVRKTGAPPNHSVEPFLSNLNGQDHWALRQAGLKPIGFVFGNCSWYQVSGWRNQNLDYSMMGNGEYPDFTQGIYNAREIAMERLENEARRMGAYGVIGVTIDPQIETYEVDVNNQRRRDLIVQFTAYGTAINWESGRKPDFVVGQTISLRD
ncbi:MAG TPA: heavy metal-binding domain-containing protein [Fimbriimonas sp.]|nr:heavy metal-binding domain-containing protein [Fimbriimonas sp.]